MSLYKAFSNNSKAFTLTNNDALLGELLYKKWYSFNAEIHLPNLTQYSLEPKGIWDSKIILKQDEKVLLDFKMNWKGIAIRTFFNEEEKHYLLRSKSMWKSQYELINSDKKELLTIDVDFKWNKLNYDYTFNTTEEFDKLKHKKLILLTLIHCINYYLSVVAAI